MAKQRGIHQIKGKINNLCYYEQKYVRGGLIRRINEAMSERLKSDPAFANTRVANTIFGGASMCAGVILEHFSSRASFLFKPYRQALLTKLVMKDLSASGPTSIFPVLLDIQKMIYSFPSVLDNIVKNKLRDDFPSFPDRLEDVTLNSSRQFEVPYDDLVAFCEKNKCIGIQFSVSPSYNIDSVRISSDQSEYPRPIVNPGGRPSTVNWLKDSASTDDLSLSANTGEGDFGYLFWIIYASPILATKGGRPITGKTGASCGVVSFSSK